MNSEDAKAAAKAAEIELPITGGKAEGAE